MAAETTVDSRGCCESAPYVWLPFLLMARPAGGLRGARVSRLYSVGAAASWDTNGGRSASRPCFSAWPIRWCSSRSRLWCSARWSRFIAVQSGSLIPGMLFHATYNSLMLPRRSCRSISTRSTGGWPVAKSLCVDPCGGQLEYRTPIVIVAGVAGGWSPRVVPSLPDQATKEERLSDVRALQSQQLAGSVE